MTTEKSTPLSFPVKVGHVSHNPLKVHIDADATERAGLAALWEVSAVTRLSADLEIQRWKKDGVRVKGRVVADIVQACVVTLDPVEAWLDEPVDAIFVPEGSRLARDPLGEAGELLIDPDGPDAPEIFTGDTIDAGAVAAEYAALAIDPYPRKAGTDFSDHVESSEKDDRKPSPFAVLKDWKKT